MRQNGCTVALFPVLDKFSTCSICDAERDRALDVAHANDRAVLSSAEGKALVGRMVELTMEGFEYIAWGKQHPMPPELQLS